MSLLAYFCMRYGDVFMTWRALGLLIWQSLYFTFYDLYCIYHVASAI